MNPEWKLRTYAWYYRDEKDASMEEMVNEAVSAAEKCNSKYLKVVGVKLFMDGVVEAHTGWLLDGYTDEPDYHGVARNTDVEKLKSAVVLTNAVGMNIHVHSIGDVVSKTILDAIELAQQETGNYDQRNAIAHLQLIRPEDIRRACDNNVVAVVAPLWVPREEGYTANEIKYLGEERESISYPIQYFRDNGGVIVFHTDFPVSAKMNIPETIFDAITRYNSENDLDTIRSEDEAIVRREELLAFTKNVAYMWHEEDRLGTLEICKIANMTIYDKDFMNAPVEEISGAELMATIVDGEEVYAKSLAPVRKLTPSTIGSLMLRASLGLEELSIDSVEE